MTGQIIRPVGWQAQNDIPASFTRSGHLYRGMTEQEYLAHKKAGYIQSTGRYSFAEEGTNFSDRADDAEGYVNFGREDPRKTGRPNYLIEVRNDPSVFTLWRDGYYKTPQRIPLGCITRVWIMFAKDGAIVAQDTSLTREGRNPVPITEIPSGPYWHGTGYAAGQSILKDRTLCRKPTGIHREKGLWASVPERVYVTTIPYYAAIYALGGDMAGSNIPTHGMGTNPEKRYGYLFQVEPSPSSDAIVDEDQLGELAVEGSMPWLTEKAKRLVTASTWKRAKEGEYKDWVRVGKALHRKMSPKEEAEVFAHATQFAIKGDVRVVKAWRVDRTRTLEMKREDIGSVLAVSEEVPLAEERNPTRIYLYHETRRDSLGDIKQEGLLPLSYGQWFVGEQGEVLSPDAFEEEELEDAPEEDLIQRLYVMTSEPNGLKYGDFLLRFPREAGGKLEHDVDPYVLSQIPAELIEIRVDGTWKPLSEEKNPSPKKPKASLDLIPEALRAVADRIYAAGLHSKFGARDVLAWMVGDKPRIGFRGPSLSIENHVLTYDHRMMGNYGHSLDVQIQRAFFPADPVLGKRGEGVTGGRGQRLDEPDVEMGDVIVMMEQLLSELILGDPDGGASVVILPDEGAPHVPGQRSQTPYYSAKARKVLVGREPAGTTIGQTPRWEVVEYGVLASADEYAYSINPCQIAKTVDPGPVDREVFGMFRDGLRVMISHSFDPTTERKEAAKGIVQCSGLIYPSLSIGPIPAANFGRASLISLVPPVIQRLRPYADKKRGAHEIVVYDTDAWTGRTSEAAGVQAAILWAQLSGNWSPPPYTDVHMWTLGPQITEGPAKAKTIKDTKALHTLVKRVTRAWKRGTALSDLERHIAANEKSYYGYGEVKVQGIYPLSAFPLCVAAGDVAEQTRTFLKSIGWAGSLIILPQKNPGDINMDLLDHAWQVSDAVHQYAEKHRLVMAINQ